MSTLHSSPMRAANDWCKHLASLRFSTLFLFIICKNPLKAHIGGSRT
jgi:hypothetical protein